MGGVINNQAQFPFKHKQDNVRLKKKKKMVASCENSPDAAALERSI